MAAALVCGAVAAKGAEPTVLHISSHLPKRATVTIDAGKPIEAPGYGSTAVAIAAGRHVLSVKTAAGVSYKADLDLKPAALMRWKGRGYWCVNLLEGSVDVYSTEDCEEDVTDAG